MQSSASVRSLGAQPKLRSSMSQRSGVSLRSQAPEGMTEEAWADIVRFNTLLHAQEQERQRQQREEKKALIKAELSRQMEEKRLAKRRELTSEEEYAQFERQQIQDHLEAERRKQLERSLKIKQEAQVRAEQLQAQIQQRNEEIRNERVLGN